MMLSEIESRSELSHSAWKKGIGVERMNVRERRFQRKLEEFQRENERLTTENTFFREENERLTAENIYLLMEAETLTLKVLELEGKGKSKKEPIIPPNTSGLKKKPGRKPGFKGTSRKKPDHIDECIDVTLSTCPQCGTPLKDPVDVTERTVEDVDPPKPRITEYKTYRYYCPHCGEIVSATSQDAIPKCRLGINVTLLAVYLKYGLHLSFGKICENLKICFGIKTTKATIYNHIRLLSHYYTEEFEEIKRQIRESEAVHVDETGWRINGTNHWLWAFVTKNAALFTIDKRRSSDVPKEVLGKDFDGVLISDFYSAYDKLPYKKQKCLVHLLRETHKISEKNPETKRFHKWTKRFFRDAAKFKENPHSQKEILQAKKRFQARIDRKIAEPHTDPNCIRLAKRLKKHRDDLLTFLEIESVDCDNNRAERAIRPHVIIRKLNGVNKSETGAENHETMMSVIETHKLRNENFLEKGAKFMKNQLGQQVTSKN